jgi:N-ethylmaleimide reductase
VTLLHLFTPWSLGPYELEHRVVMPPLTRMRAEAPRNVAGAAAAEYYAQRTSRGGLIIAEASQVSPVGQGFPTTPGIYSAEQVEGWRQVTKAVHDGGGVIFLQLWHVGRVSHRSFQPKGQLPVAPSAVAPEAGEAFTADWDRVPFEVPQELAHDQILDTIESYKLAAKNAEAAGFDGVEIHAANGYLIEQFLHGRSNLRTDEYGGSIENRSRFLHEVADVVVGVWGPERVGVRLSPFGVANGSGEEDAFELYSHAIKGLDEFDIAYLHLIEPRASGMAMADVDHQGVPSASTIFRSHWRRALIAAGGYDGESADAKVAAAEADAVAFGRHFVANPDLPARMRTGWPLNPYHRPTFYGGGAEGYTDYPFFQADAELSSAP